MSLQSPHKHEIFELTRYVIIVQAVIATIMEDIFWREVENANIMLWRDSRFEWKSQS